MLRICVFCGSQVGINGLYRQAATDLGQLLVRHGYGLVYGGGHIGLMGVIFNGVDSREHACERQRFGPRIGRGATRSRRNIESATAVK